MGPFSLITLSSCHTTGIYLNFLRTFWELYTGEDTFCVIYILLWMLVDEGKIINWRVAGGVMIGDRRCR